MCYFFTARTGGACLVVVDVLVFHGEDRRRSLVNRSNETTFSFEIQCGFAR